MPRRDRAQRTECPPHDLAERLPPDDQTDLRRLDGMGPLLEDLGEVIETSGHIFPPGPGFDRPNE